MIEEDEEEYGIRKPMRKKDPKEPNKEERDEHEKRISRSGIGVGIV